MSTTQHNVETFELSSINFLFPFCSFRAKKIIIGKTPIDRLLTLDTDQVINANVTIHGNVTIKNGSDIEINHLFAEKPIFGIDLQALLDDSYFPSPNESIVITSPKFFEDITIEHLVVEGDFWQVGLTMAEVEKRLEELKTGINITGPITFDNHFTINDLSVTGAINDIPSERFGKEWLLLEGAQVSESGNFFLSRR